MTGFFWAAAGLFALSAVFVTLTVLIGLRIGMFKEEE